jgi:hypothetical protein
MLKSKKANGVSIMIVIHLYNSSEEADEVFRNESNRLLKYGYIMTTFKGYTVLYREGCSKTMENILK